MSIKICEGYLEEIWYGRCKTNQDSYGHLDLDDGGNPVDQKLYRSMIGSLLYLTASRPVFACMHDFKPHLENII